jgi:AraC-like DNA-binding protein
MLSATTVLSRDGIEIADVVCTHGRGRGRPNERKRGTGFVFVRRGCFVRSADGEEALLDPTLAYFARPGTEERFDHPHAHGDDCTWLGFEPSLIAALWAGEPTPPSIPLRNAPGTDLEQRLLLAAAQRGADAHELVERAIGLAARLLEGVDPRRLASGRPATARARQALADGARELLAGDAERPLPELAAELAVSPHHLSRVFREVTGQTVSRHRMRLRARAALERLAGGDKNLARLAADLGFADQSHLCRVLRSETGSAPSALRRALAA